MKKLIYSLLIFALLTVAQPIAVQASTTWQPCVVKTDMQLAHVYDIQTNYHSRTRLPAYSHLPGGETTATMRLMGGRGNVQYPPEWMDYVINVLNAGPNQKQAENYLFPPGGGSKGGAGIQNGPQKGRMEELTTEGNTVGALQLGAKVYLWTFHTDEKPPAVRDLTDPRIQRITVVNRLDQLTRSKPFDVYFPLMARPGERLWLVAEYLDCGPQVPRVVTVQTWPNTLNIRATPGGQWLGSYQDGEKVQVTALQTVAGNIWGQTWRGWIALYYGGRWFTDWKVTP